MPCTDTFPNGDRRLSSLTAIDPRNPETENMPEDREQEWETFGLFPPENMYGVTMPDGSEMYIANDGGGNDVSLWEEASHHWKATINTVDGEFVTVDLGTCRGPHAALNELNRQIIDQEVTQDLRDEAVRAHDAWHEDLGNEELETAYMSALTDLDRNLEQRGVAHLLVDDITQDHQLGLQLPQIVHSVSDALKASMDEPQPQQGTGMSEVARDQIEKLQEDVRAAEAKARQRGGMER